LSDSTPSRLNPFELASKKLNFKTKLIHYSKKNHFKKNFLEKIAEKLNFSLDFNKFNYRIRNIDNHNFDFIIVEKGFYVWPSTIIKLKKKYPLAKFIYYTHDNYKLTHNRNFFTDKTIKENLYDLIILYDIKSRKNYLEKISSTNVYYRRPSYCKTLHKNLNTKKIYDVCFIGTFEENRYEYIKFLSLKGIKITVYGTGWEKIPCTKNLTIFNRDLINYDYVFELSKYRICLCFFRHLNQDTQTSRTYEIPASGNFGLYEYSSDHAKLFSQFDKKLIFKNKNDLLKSVIFYLNNPKLRVSYQKKITKFILKDNSYEDLLLSILGNFN
jgi:spore maturation protein CgeB